MNSALIVEGHPLLVVEDIVTRNGIGLNFTYSQYEIAQPGLQWIAPRSAVLRVRASEITPDWLIARLTELRPEEEIAWHSLVESKGAAFHIPMIDLVGRPSPAILRDLSQALVAVMGVDGHFVFFDTGQSFHGYLAALITERAWQRYLEGLLILNDLRLAQVIDTRWVGHALKRGFTALRWSHNTNRYRAMPHLISLPNSDNQ